MSNQASPFTDFRRHLGVEGPEFGIRVKRTELARAGEKHSTTVSSDAVAVVANQVQDWVTSRIIRASQDLSDVVPLLQVVLTLTFDVAPQARELRFTMQPDSPSLITDGSTYSAAALAAVSHKAHRWLLDHLAEIIILEGQLPQALTLTVHAAPPSAEG